MRRKARETKPAPPPRPPRDALVSLVTGLLGIVLAACVLYFLYYSYIMVRFPFQLDYGEGPILQIALRFAHGEAMYPPLDRGYPYVIASYMPFYYVLCGLLAHLTGPSFLGGRLLSVVSALVIAGVSGLLVWQHTRHRFASFLAGAITLAMPIFWVWGSLLRTDTVGLAFSVLGFWLFLRGRRPAGVVCLALAVLTRWTNLAAIAGALSGLIFARKWKEAAIWGGVQLALILLLVLGSNAATHGGMFRVLSVHTKSSLGASWTWDQVLLLLGIAQGQWPVYFVVGALGALWCAFRPIHRPVAVYLLASWAVFFTSGRIGSTFNYLMEPVVVGAIATGLMWAELSALDPAKLSAAGRALARPALLGMGGALALQMIFTMLAQGPSYAISLLRPEAVGAASAYVVDRIRDAPGPVLCEDVGLNVLAGRDVPIDPFEFTQFAHKRAFDPEPVYRDVREGKFPLIVLRFDPEKTGPDRGTGDWGAGRWPDGIISALRQHYRLGEEQKPYLLYVPRG